MKNTCQNKTLHNTFSLLTITYFDEFNHILYALLVVSSLISRPPPFLWRGGWGEGR